jgi:arylsulfatase A-like enzyme
MQHRPTVAGHRGLPKRRLTGRAGLAVALAVLASACSARPPNVVLVTIDTIRVDRIGAYGSSQGLTPHLDRLASQATVFERCTTPMPSTRPAHASMLTGLRPRTHGVRSNAQPLAAEIPTLAERLRDAGYTTGAFVALKSLVAKSGLDRGFQTVSDASPSRPFVRSGRDVNALARRWLGERDDRPFFAWIHYYEPHTPLELTPYAAARLRDYRGPYAEGASVPLYYGTSERWMRSPVDRAAIETLYDGEVREVDVRVGELLTTLHSFGLRSDTLVIVTGDHGQSLGERGIAGHGNSLFEPVLRVPLIIDDPRRRAVARVAEPVSLIDVTPTVLDLAGVPIPTGVQGRSLAPALRGEELPPRRHVSQLRDARRRDDPATFDRVAVYEGSFKFLLFPSGGTLFDLRDDPREDHAIPRERMLERFDRLRAVAEEFRAARLASQAAPAPAPDPDVLEELRALGYVR